MCGRYIITETPDVIREHFEFVETPSFPARYNIAPAQPVPIVRLENGERHFSLVRWGLVPSWAKEIDAHGPLINARSETITDLPSFRGPVRHRRCLFICDGFYEWQKLPQGRKQPWLIRKKDRGTFAIAGIWEHWMNAEGSELETGALITVDANNALEGIHHRMPAILTPEDYDDWLDCVTVQADLAVERLQPAPNSLMEAWPISTRVNKIENDDLTLLDEDRKSEDPPAPKRQPDLFD